VILLSMTLLDENGSGKKLVFGSDEVTGELLGIDTGLDNIEAALCTLRAGSLGPGQAVAASVEHSGGLLDLHAWRNPGTAATAPTTVYWQVLGTANP
jgi:hypothetical protein